MIRNVGTRLATSTTWANQRHLMAAHSSQLAPLSAAERPYGHPISRDRGGTSESWDSTIGTTWHNSLQKMIQKDDSTSLFSFSKKISDNKMLPNDKLGVFNFLQLWPTSSEATCRSHQGGTLVHRNAPGAARLFCTELEPSDIYIYIHTLYTWIHVYIYTYTHTQ